MAASVIQKEPAAIQLRYLQTVSEIATENNSTTLFPIPIDLFRPFLEKMTGSRAEGSQSSAAPTTPALPAPTVPQPDLSKSEAERETARAKSGE
jgi:hypothetical protein